MGRAIAIRAAVAAAALFALGPGAALAAGGSTKFEGETAQGREAKVVVDSTGRAVRGSWTVLTDCDGRFEDFRARITMRAPLDRSTPDSFRDVGSEGEGDGTYSARYKHEVEGRHRGRHRIKGSLSVKITFRRNGEKYVTCSVDDLAFKVTDH